MTMCILIQNLLKYQPQACWGLAAEEPTNLCCNLSPAALPSVTVINLVLHSSCSQRAGDQAETCIVPDRLTS